MSVDTPGKLPNVEAVKLVIELIGYDYQLEDCIVKTEELTRGHHAINIWEVAKT